MLCLLLCIQACCVYYCAEMLAYFYFADSNIDYQITKYNYLPNLLCLLGLLFYVYMHGYVYTLRRIY